MQGYVLTELRVLVVEKQLFMRRLLGDVMRQLGIRNVVKVANIREGVEVVSKHDFDLVLLDWAPDMDAVKFLSVVRSAEASRNPFIPVIVITAYSEHKRVCEARDAGMTEYLVKPISAQALYARIKATIERHRKFIKTGSFFGPDRRRRDDAPPGGERRKYRPLAQNVSGQNV